MLICLHVRLNHLRVHRKLPYLFGTTGVFSFAFVHPTICVSSVSCVASFWLIHRICVPVLIGCEHPSICVDVLLFGFGGPIICFSDSRGISWFRRHRRASFQRMCFRFVANPTICVLDKCRFLLSTQRVSVQRKLLWTLWPLTTRVFSDNVFAYLFAMSPFACSAFSLE